MSDSEFPAHRCEQCGELYGHPPVVCRECTGEVLSKHELSGRGTVYSSTTIRVPGSDHKGEEPFEVCLVDVGETERVRVTARVKDAIGLSPGDAVTFVDERDGVFYFSPVGKT